MKELELEPMMPSEGPPLPKSFNLRWPGGMGMGGAAGGQDLEPTSPEEGPPLPKALKLKWPWKS